MGDIDDFETWLIEAGDAVIVKESAQGPDVLSAAERAVYDLWAIDYAVRNAGDMEALEDVRPNAVTDLSAFLQTESQAELAHQVLELKDAGDDCDSYCDLFDGLCGAVKTAMGRS